MTDIITDAIPPISDNRLFQHAFDTVLQVVKDYLTDRTEGISRLPYETRQAIEKAEEQAYLSAQAVLYACIDAHTRRCVADAVRAVVLTIKAQESTPEVADAA